LTGFKDSVARVFAPAVEIILGSKGRPYSLEILGPISGEQIGNGSGGHARRSIKSWYLCVSCWCARQSGKEGLAAQDQSSLEEDGFPKFWKSFEGDVEAFWSKHASAFPCCVIEACHLSGVYFRKYQRQWRCCAKGWVYFSKEAGGEEC